MEKITKFENEIEELEKDDQLLSRCATLPPMFCKNKNYSDAHKFEILKKYLGDSD